MPTFEEECEQADRDVATCEHRGHVWFHEGTRGVKGDALWCGRCGEGHSIWLRATHPKVWERSQSNA